VEESSQRWLMIAQTKPSRSSHSFRYSGRLTAAPARALPAASGLNVVARYVSARILLNQNFILLTLILFSNILSLFKDGARA
jgi:hypothetical protein